MASFNRVTLIGTLGKDPEFKDMPNGERMCKLSVATSERWKEKGTGEKKEKTQWHNVIIWNKFLVETSERFLAKGSAVHIEGAIEYRKYEKDGKDAYITEIVLSRFKGELNVLSATKERTDEKPIYGDEAFKRATEAQKPIQVNGSFDDDIPF